MSENMTPLGAIVRGITAGIGGTLILSMSMKEVPSLLEKAGIDLPSDTRKSGAGGGRHAAKPVERLAGKLASDVFEKDLDRKQKQVGGQVLHWAYGLGWGAFYGIMRGSLPFPGIVQGAVLAGIMGVTAATVIPSMRLTPPLDEIPTERKALQQTYILFYAWTTALIFGLLTRKKKHA
jgi:hypothetical protein